MAKSTDQLDAGDLGEPIDPATLGGGNDGPGGDGGNSYTGDDRTFDPARHISPDKRNADGTFRRKRVGGKRGPNKRSAAPSSLDLGVVSSTLLFWHTAAAGALRAPELQLDKSEADLLGKALIQVEQQFPTQIDPRMIALLNLAGALGMVYGPRVVAIRMRVKEEAKERKPKADVLRFPDTFQPSPSA